MLKIIIQGMRVKTLVAAIIPPLVAHGIYIVVEGRTSYLYLGLCLLLALFIQISTNFYNDAIDYLKGADDNDRKGPERITQEKKISTQHVFYIGHLFLLAAFLVGIPLVVKGGVVFLIIGLISLFFAYGYTGGPFPLAYLGLGELFVFIFFGLVATCGSYYLYSAKLGVYPVLAAVQIGLLSSALIAINNYRDRKTDVLVNKNTLATKLTKKQYLLLLDAFLFLPYLLLLVYLPLALEFFIPLLAISFAHKVRGIVHNYQDEIELNEALKFAGIHLLLFGLLFYFCCLWI